MKEYSNSLGSNIFFNNPFKDIGPLESDVTPEGFPRDYRVIEERSKGAALDGVDMRTKRVVTNLLLEAHGKHFFVKCHVDPETGFLFTDKDRYARHAVNLNILQVIRKELGFQTLTGEQLTELRKRRKARGYRD